MDVYLGYRLNAETCGEVVRAVVDDLAGQGLILVRADLGESIAQKVEKGCPYPDEGEHPCDYPLAAQIVRDAFKEKLSVR